ncbi:MAG: hypothetical protein FWF57_01275 [Defluviitaleaceae bacterium]|nr:hypothetical protein [Defluviitaleaceae bacterium]
MKNNTELNNNNNFLKEKTKKDKEISKNKGFAKNSDKEMTENKDFVKGNTKNNKETGITESKNKNERESFGKMIKKIGNVTYEVNFYLVKRVKKLYKTKY